MDPILDSSTSARLQLFPIEYDELWELYTKAKAAFWTAAEIDLSKDLTDWDECLTNNERYLISTVLAFFASSDAIVNENLVMRFCSEVQIPKVHYFYTYQAIMENIYSEVYGLLIDTYIREPDERLSLFWAINKHPPVKAKANWALQWITNPSSFSTRLVAFAAIKGIFFSGSFTVIFWLKKQGLMPGLTFSNELISQDEGLHTQFAAALYHTLKVPLSLNIIIEVIHSAVNIEQQFWDSAFNAACLSLDADHMKMYIEYVANYLLVSLGMEKIYGTANPFNFMELISLEGKTNFFERCVGEYSCMFITVGGMQHGL
ncbi:ribonucleotide reductase small subunit [Armillaria nabsnona]|nr:ribonucleotide reductase small subunit [Armillaria nabsnona]